MAGVGGVSALAGCMGGGGGGGNESGETDPNSVDFWTLFGGGDGDAMEAMVDEYNQQSDVEVNRQRQPWDEYYDKLYTALTGGNPPDLAVVHTSQLETYSDVLQPLDDLIDSETESAYLESIWSETEIDGNRLSLPLDTHPAAFYYNKDIFEQAGLDPESPPASPEEFSDACDTIVSETDHHAFGATPYGPHELIRTFLMFIRQDGGQLLNDDRTAAAFDDETGLGVAEYLSNVTGEWEWDSPEMSDNRWEKAFYAGELAILQNGTWFYGPASEQDFEFGVFKPFVYSESEQYTWADSHTLAIPHNPDREEEIQQAALDAAIWLTQETTTWGTDAGHLPASEALLESDELRSSDVWEKTLSTFYEMAEEDQLAYVPRTESISEYQEPLSTNLAEIYSQNLTPEEGIQQAADGVNSALE